MTKENKNKWLQWIQTGTMIITFLIVVFGGYRGAIAWGEWKAEMKAEMKERMFKDSEERVKTEQMVAEPYSKYRMMMKNDTILEQQKFLMGGFDALNKRDSADIEDKKDRIISRAKRDSVNRLILLSLMQQQVKQTQQSQEIKKILKKLDSIK